MIELGSEVRISQTKSEVAIAYMGYVTSMTSREMEFMVRMMP